MVRYTYRDASGECWYQGGTVADHLHRLTEYEDAEEQGLIARLIPRKVKIDTEPDREYVDFRCPCCGDTISQRRKGMNLSGAPGRYVAMYMPAHHDKCGQALDWESTREEAEAAISKKLHA